MRARHPSVDAFLALGATARREALVGLAEKVSLRVWAQFVARRGRIAYRDSVVGVKHALDVELPALALRALRGDGDIDAIAEAYREPVTALQDMDLELPDSAEFAYYSIYNLFRKHCAGEDVEELLILNQILSSLADESQMEAALRGWP